jgi:hypothetical protein
MQLETIQGEKSAAVLIGAVPTPREKNIILGGRSCQCHSPRLYTALCGKIGNNFSAAHTFLTNALYRSIRNVFRHCRRLDAEHVASLGRERAGGGTAQLA